MRPLKPSGGYHIAQHITLPLTFRKSRLGLLSILTLASLFLTSQQRCYSGIEIIPFEGLTNSCSYAKASMPTNLSSAGIYSFDPGDEAKKWLSSILLKTGIGDDKFDLRIGVVSNALATVIGAKRYIFYNEDWLTASLKKSPGGEQSWPALGVFAHEIGHHFNNHTFGAAKKLEERHRDELEADQWAGFVLANMGANEEEALAATREFADENASDTHPPRVARTQAVRDGWRKADRQKKNEKVTASFNSDVISGAAPLKVHFKSASLGTIKKHTWAFGDGAFSTDTNPDHDYTKPGSYTVALTVEGSLGQDAQVKPNFIQVLSPLKADFESVPREGVAPLSVSFKAMPQGNSYTYSWDFGDSGKSDLATPTHEYKKPGEYTVRLTVKDSASEHTESKPNFIIIRKESPTVTEAAAPETTGVEVDDHVLGVFHPSFQNFLGVRIKLSGKIENIKGKDIRVIARFEYYNNLYGRNVPLMAHPQESRFKDGDGRVAIKTAAWKSPTDSFDFEDVAAGNTPKKSHPLDLFLPYYALNFAPGSGTITMLTSIEILVSGKRVYETPDGEAAAWTLVKNF